MSSSIAYVNGAFVPHTEARISIFDRGYLFGDGVYEVVSVIDGRILNKTEFLNRLDRSLRAISLGWPCSREDYLAFHEELITRNNLTEGTIYSQVTRGVADRDFGFPSPDTAPGVMAFTSAKPILDNPKAQTGVGVVTVDDIRWKRRDIKSIALLGQVLAKQQAVQAGAFEGWMMENGHITEGTSSSAFIIKGNTIITHPLTSDILPGIRRHLVLDLAAQNGIGIEQRPFTLSDAYGADEAFLTSASLFVLPVVKVNGHPIGTGTPGPIVQMLREKYIAHALQNARS